MGEYVTIKDACALLGLSKAAIHKRIVRGKIPARLVPTGRAGNPHYLIPAQAIEAAMVKEDGWVSISEAVERTGESKFNLQYACQTGKLQGRRGDREQWMVQIAEIEAGTYKAKQPRVMAKPVDVEDVLGDYEADHGAPADEEDWMQWKRQRWVSAHHRVLPDNRIAIDASEIF